jgi:hypothetical protein
MRVKRGEHRILSSKISARRIFLKARDAFTTKGPRGFPSRAFMKTYVKSYRAARCRLFRELCDPMREPRHSAARIVLMNDAQLRRPHDGRLSALHRLVGLAAVAGRDCLLDVAH